MQDSLKQEAINMKRRVAERSILSFARAYLSRHLKINPSKAHLEIYDVLKDILEKRNRKIAIAAFRDFGKSTQVTLIYLLYCICFTRERFIVIISNTASQAKQILDNVKDELTQNEGLREAFPEVFEMEGKPRPPRWTEDEIITRNGIRVLALGSGQQIRGRRHGIYRPTLVIADDLENSDNTFTFEAREKMKKWFEKSVLRVGSEGSNFCIVGNLFHPHSLLGEFQDKALHPGWESFKYRAIEAWPRNMQIWETWSKILHGQEQFNGNVGNEAALAFYFSQQAEMDGGAVLTWPEKFSLFDLMLMREENKVSFDAEMQNEPIDPGELAMDVESIHYWTDKFASAEDLLKTIGNEMEFFGALDPSLGKSAEKGDYSAIIVLGRDKQGLLYILEADIARRSVDKQIRDVLAYAQRYKFVQFAIEANMFQELISQKVVEESRKASIYLNVKPIKNITDKLARIQCLYSSVKNGTLQFSRNHKLLLDECRAFPKGRTDDGLDALEMSFRCVQDGSTVRSETIIGVLKNLVEHRNYSRMVSMLNADGRYARISDT
jgi:predicted phage terminase large subunit-like protein